MAERSKDGRIINSWQLNAAAWVRAVRNEEIESRRLVTDAAIVEAVLDRHPRSVLDLGCGEGWLSRALRREGVDVLGVDVVPEFIDAAQKLGGATYRVMSYEEVARGDLSLRVDAVVCNFSLIGATVVDDVVSAIPLLLAEGGALIVQTLHPVTACGEHPYEDGWREGSWDGFSAEFSDPAPWYFRTVKSWEELFRTVGFRSVRTVEPRHPATQEPASLILIGEIQRDRSNPGYHRGS